MRPVRLDAARAALAGWALLGAVNAAMIAITLRVPRSGLGTRALHHAYDAGQLLALGVLSAAGVLLWQRFVSTTPFGSRRFAPFLGIFAVGLALGAWMLRDDFHGFAGNLVGDRLSFVVVALAIATCAGVLAACAFVGSRLARGYLRLLPIAGAIALVAANHKVVAHDYPGVHFFVAAWAAALASTALASPTDPTARARTSWFWVAGVAVVSLWTLFLAPSNTVRLELFRSSGSVVAPFVARIESQLSRTGNVAVSPESVRWFKSRDGLPEIPPTAPRLFAKNAIVLVLVIDAGRADLLKPEHDRALPNLARLRDASVQFTNARTPAPGTTLAVTSVFTSRYRAQIRWADQRGREYPHLDPSPRFPELLQKQGVVTLNLQGLPGLAMAQGILRGFSEEKILGGRPGHFAGASEMLPALMERLGRATSGAESERAFFAYQHYDDAHAPYDLGGKKATPFESYLAEVQGVDRALGRLLDFLEEKQLASRTTLIVTADHGEAFGEHNKQFHATTLYEELLHVPLLVKVPGIAPRKVDAPVSLVDLAPTLLDGFGLPTPGSFMGQSLVPLLRDPRAPALGRPIVAESDRGHRAMVFPDGMKLIADDKLHTLELYDLNRDPGELENLFDIRPDAGAQRRALLDSFFDAQRLRR